MTRPKSFGNPSEASEPFCCGLMVKRRKFHNFWVASLAQKRGSRNLLNYCCLFSCDKLFKQKICFDILCNLCAALCVREFSYCGSATKPLYRSVKIFSAADFDLKFKTLIMDKRTLTWLITWLSNPLVLLSNWIAFEMLVSSLSANQTGGVCGYVSCNRKVIRKTLILHIKLTKHKAFWAFNCYTT